ncbi:MAG: MBL fold metallo-hydrolase [Lachnospiraceae bacterium]|nr:MBL fold metallo-hydrolase [Lachnospiraceae bacterium]
MQKLAILDYYADDGEQAPQRYRYIGIDKNIGELSQVKFLDGDAVIDDELEIFTVKKRSHELPSTNKRLLIKKASGYERDSFNHEHFLVVREDSKTVLLSGCAHNGILSILDAYIEKYGKAPDVVVSGFHLMNKKGYSEEDMEEVKDIAYQLMEYPTKFYTCHCTGVEPYEVMKEIMGDKLEYVHSGDEVRLDW